MATNVVNLIEVTCVLDPTSTVTSVANSGAVFRAPQAQPSTTPANTIPLGPQRWPI